MEVREQRAVLARMPAKEIKQRRIGRGVGSCLSAFPVRFQPPHRAAAFIKAENPPGCFVEPDITETARPFRKAGAPLSVRDQPTLMRLVPSLDSDFDRNQPGERK